MKSAKCHGCEYLYYKDKRFFCLWYKSRMSGFKWGRIVPVERINKCGKENG